jgi:hypothetical protein
MALPALATELGAALAFREARRLGMDSCEDLDDHVRRGQLVVRLDHFARNQ